MTILRIFTKIVCREARYVITEEEKTGRSAQSLTEKGVERSGQRRDDASGTSRSVTRTFGERNIGLKLDVGIGIAEPGRGQGERSTSHDHYRAGVVTRPIRPVSAVGRPIEISVSRLNRCQTSWNCRPSEARCIVGVAITTCSKLKVAGFYSKIDIQLQSSPRNSVGRRGGIVFGVKGEWRRYTRIWIRVCEARSGIRKHVPYAARSAVPHISQ